MWSFCIQPSGTQGGFAQCSRVQCFFRSCFHLAVRSFELCFPQVHATTHQNMGNYTNSCFAFGLGVWCCWELWGWAVTYSKGFPPVPNAIKSPCPPFALLLHAVITGVPAPAALSDQANLPEPGIVPHRSEGCGSLPLAQSGDASPGAERARCRFLAGNGNWWWCKDLAGVHCGRADACEW